jgi:hypothetical protein
MGELNAAFRFRLASSQRDSHRQRPTTTRHITGFCDFVPLEYPTVPGAFEGRPSVVVDREEDGPVVLVTQCAADRLPQLDAQVGVVCCVIGGGRDPGRDRLVCHLDRSPTTTHI